MLQDVFLEKWIFLCPSCLTVWEEQFEVHHTDDEHGHTSVNYHKDGQPHLAPWTERPCTNCGRHAVKARPTPWSRRVKLPVPPSRADTDLVYHLRKLRAY